MPQVRPGQTQKEYIEMCIPYVMKHEGVKTSKEAAGLCYGLWRQHTKQSKGESYLQEAMEEYLNEKEDNISE